MSSKSSGSGRVAFFIIGVIVLTGLTTYRLFNLTYIKHQELASTASGQYNNPAALLSGRGNIYFSDYSSGVKELAATNRSSYYVYSNNSGDLSKDDIAKMSREIGMSPDDLNSKVNGKGNGYLVIVKGLSKSQADTLRALNIKGIVVASEIERFYVEDTLASSVLGFVGFEGKQRVGQYGVELSYDDILSGINRTQNFLGNKTYSGIIKYLKFWSKEDSQESQGDTFPVAEGGSDIVLTLDANIQSMVEVKLKELINKWSAEGGSIVVQDPLTGAILAMASYPGFDPNNYSEYELSSFINPVSQKVFEPGSSFKTITMAGAIDSGAVRPDTTYNDTGQVEVAGYTIRNFDEKSNGIQTMRQVLEHSLNTGAIFAEEKTGDDKFINYVVGFGFGQKSGVDLNGEVSGNIANLYSGRKINFLTASFGQGIAVTPLQLVNSYSAIANGGKLMKPYLVKEVIRSDGSALKSEPVILGAPITEKTSAQIRSMLVDVVDNGFDRARVAGYDIAGKTGTAQIPGPDGGYLGDNQFVHDFVGFAPASSPRFTILIKMDKPQGIRFAADSLSPVFGDIARYLIRYFNIPPTRN